MKFLNSILLEGDLIAQPSFFTSPDGIPRCTFSLASGDTAPAVPVITYGRLAERCSSLLDQGSVIRIVGRIAQDVEATTATGNFSLIVAADHVEIKPSSSHKVPTEAANAF
jgi:primosomal replication protein N